MKNLILILALLVTIGQASAETINTVATSFDDTIVTMSEKIMASKDEETCIKMLEESGNESEELYDQCVDQAY